MSSGRGTAAILSALLGVAIVAVLALRAAGVPIAVGDASPSLAPSPSPADGESPTAQPTEVPDLAAAFREIEQQMIEIRGLPAADIGPAEVISREQLMDELKALFDADYPPEEREADNVSLRAFGLLGPDEDAYELQLRLLGDQVLGFYDDVEKRMVVVSDAGLDANAKLTYAHEYVHALQDAAFGIDSLERDVPGEDDRGLARTALLEGDATLAMLLWAFQHLAPDELAEIGQTPIPDTHGVPDWMVSLLSFPYDQGAQWVQLVWGETQSFESVDAVYADPPTSTAQIIHYQDKWATRADPAEIAVPDLATGLGTGWREVDTSPMGEAMIGILLEHFGVPSAEADVAADGWAGDRYVVAIGPDDALAVVWRLRWDRSTDADEFADAYPAALDALPFPARLVGVSATEQLVVHASSDELLDAAIRIAGQ